MDSSKVSVIITCFNQENYISNTIQSVLDQTYSNWECIIVDDGSRDASVDIINGFCKKDNRILLIQQKNQGVSVARNVGFSRSKGELIQFLDGDDTLLPQKIEKQLLEFNKYPDISISICGHQHFFVNENKYETFVFEPIQEKPLVQFIYDWQNGVAFTNHAALYKRNIWSENELPFPIDYKGRSEDWVFNVLVALKGLKYYFLDEILCNYHIHQDNFTNQVYNSASSAIEAAFYLKPLLPKEYQKDIIEKTIRKSFNRYLENEIVHILHSSGNWRLGNFITKPFFRLRKLIK
jgi:glycosyltransferase involved in cell wall biosynthesis